MSRIFELQDLGEGIFEVEIIDWLVKEGDSVDKDQPLLEVMTDKANVEISSPIEGTIEHILAKRGQTVKIGSTLATFKGDSDTSISELHQTERRDNALEALRRESQGAEQYPSARVSASPATRKLAQELAVSIESVHGTGLGGRVTDEDVRNTSISAMKTQSQESSVSIKPSLMIERIPIHGIRKRTAEKMTKSAHTVAQVAHVEEVDFTNIISIRDKMKQAAQDQQAKLSFAAFVVRAIVYALKEFPYFNASVDDEKNEIILKKYYNIGVATDTTNGLIVPVLTGVDTKSIFEIVQELEEMSSRARIGKISLEELKDSTFTIANTGSVGGGFQTPIINYPEVAILGLYRIQKRPVVYNNSIVVRDMCYLVLSFDHRIVDGADAARFMNRVKSILENPEQLVTHSK